MDGGRPVFKSAERSRSGCNARCGAGYNTICSVCMWGSSRCWCATTVCTRRDGLRMYQPSLYSGWVGITGWVIAVMRDSISKDEVVESWRWIVGAMELPRWQESLLLSGTKMHLIAWRSWEFTNGPPFDCFWSLPRLQTFCTTGVVSGWALWEAMVWYRCSTVEM